MGMASVTPSPLEKWKEKVDIWGGVEEEQLRRAGGYSNRQAVTPTTPLGLSYREVVRL